MQTKKIGSPVAKAGVGEIDEDRLFIQYYGVCVGGLLASNTRYDSDALCVQEAFGAEELLEKAEGLADLMVEVIRNRSEARKFEGRLKA